MQHKLALLERMVQRLLDGLPRHRADIHFRSEHLVVVAPAFLGMIHRGVGVPDHRFNVLAVVGVEADADAQGDVEPMATDEMGLGHGLDQLFGGEDSVLRIFDFGQQHHEFVAPLAADGIREADARLQALGDRLQQLVADRMPERIVDVLEVVEVQIHQGDLLAMTLRQRDRLRQTVVQQRTVRQTGEKVVLGHIGHLRGGLLGGLGHRLGANRRDDELFVTLRATDPCYARLARSWSLSFFLLVRIDFSRRSASFSRLSAALLAQVGSLFATKNGLFGCSGPQPRARRGYFAIAEIRDRVLSFASRGRPISVFLMGTVLLAHHRLSLTDRIGRLRPRRPPAEDSLVVEHRVADDDTVIGDLELPDLVAVGAGAHFDDRHDALQAALDLDVTLDDDRVGEKRRPVGAEAQIGIAVFEFRRHQHRHAEAGQHGEHAKQRLAKVLAEGRRHRQFEPGQRVDHHPRGFHLLNEVGQMLNDLVDRQIQ